MIRHIHEGHKLEPGDLLAHRTSSGKNYVLRKISEGDWECKLGNSIILEASSLEELELFSESAGGKEILLADFDITWGTSAGGKEILLADFDITWGTMYSGYVTEYVSD